MPAVKRTRPRGLGCIVAERQALGGTAGGYLLAGPVPVSASEIT